MLISRVLEGKESDESIQKKTDAKDNSHDYHTASELFKMMSKDQSLDANDDHSFTPGDLVVLYKNIDKGAKLISNRDKFTPQKPNQYVETIVYNDDPDSEGSDISDVYSAEELQRVILVNKERLDLLNSHLSLGNKVCQKLVGVDIQSPNLTSEYNKHFLFQDPYIKDQLNYLNVGFSQLEGSLLPASLLDYICCKRLEDNYNFYMDNIITYVKHTIEQLKRISNGEYLTDRTKEKWKEVDSKDINKSAKILATSTSIPLHVESKSNGQASTWNDLVHSEVDVTYLSKILEKQIIIEVPKLICGSYKLFSKRCADNLIISCKKEKQLALENNNEEENVSRVDLVFRLQKSESGHMIGNINSIMIVQTPPNIDNDVNALVPLSFKEIGHIEGADKTVKITQVCGDEENNPNTAASTNGDAAESKDSYFGDYETQCDSVVGTNDYPNSDNDCNIFKNQSCSELNESTEFLRNSFNNEPLMQKESIHHFVASDKLRLNMKMYLPKENGKDVALWSNSVSKNKSPTRARIKSPYENRSHVLEEKKRKRLLEIRERRERKKLVLAESCKVIKQKYPKGFAIPQPSSSVTKLSITNKSFYNSIYGQAMNIENKQGKGKNHVGVKKDSIPEVPLDEIGPEGESLSLNSEGNNEKYFNSSYYLDNAITEVMYMEMNKKDNCEVKGHSMSTSAVSSDFQDNVNLFSQITGHSVPDLHKEVVTSDNTYTLNEIPIIDDEDDLQTTDNVGMPPSVENIVPANSPINVLSDNKNGPKKATLPLECRKSIDKVYNLMKKLKNVNDEKLPPKNTSLLPLDSIEARANSSIEGSDSGTSIKHHITSSNPSYFSFGKTNEIKSKIPTVKKPQTPIVPKVIISTKSQPLRSDIDKSKKNKKVLFNTPKVAEDPLKAISQLLHNIDNVQKTRYKTTESTEPIPSDVKAGSRQGNVKRYSRFDQHLKDSQFSEKNSAIIASRKPKSIFDITKLQHQQGVAEKQKRNERLIVDIIDEAREARGEAVRGPPKLHSRLNSLAQPKKSYVQAHSEEYHSKYGKNLMADRLQKLAKTPQNFVEPKVGSANSRIKPKKNETRAFSPVSAKQTPVPTIVTSIPRSASTSPKEKSGPPRAQSKYNNIPQTSETSKKTVHVDKSRYGRSSLLSGPDGVPPLEHISRVPFLPNDIDLKSDTSTEKAEESNELGNTLHYIVDTILNPKKKKSLAILSECFEANSKAENLEEFFIADSLSRKDQPILEKFDFPVDVYEDKTVITTVVDRDNKKIKQIDEGLINFVQPEVSNFTTELAKLENALCHQIPVGNSQKRLRIKNLTLTPKQSTKSHFLLQSGDTGSALLKKRSSHNFMKCDHDKLSDIKTFPILSKSDLDWSFVKYPIQITTIGYAFPKYSLLKFDSHSKLKSVTEDIKENSKSANIKVVKNSTQCSQTTKCLGTEESKVKTEHTVQVGITDNTLIDNHNPREDGVKEIKAVNVNDVIKPVVKIKSEEEQVISDGKIESSNKINDITAVDYTTSLDMLVGLLNEIQNITACHTHISSTDSNEQQCKAFETFTKDTATLGKYSNGNPQNIVSITSLDKLRQLESSSSIYSIYLSSQDEHDFCKKRSKDKFICSPIYEDKEVYADLHDRVTVNRYTEVPSLCPITVNHSTNVTNSLIGVLSEPSSQSLFSSFIEFKSTYSANSINPYKMIIEIPDKSSQQSRLPYEKRLESKKTIDLKMLTDSDITQENQQADLEIRFQNSLFYKNDQNHDFNASIKMKRDILVTVYSILVFTVFAALSFPEMMYRVYTL